MTSLRSDSSLSEHSGFRGAKTFHGIWRIAPSPMLTEIFAQAGMDFQILDCEHGSYDYATLLPDIVACERHDCAPLVRVSGTDKIEVQRCLDLGARGLVFPQLAGIDDFARAAAMMDYAPTGTRGFNPFVRAGDYGLAAGKTRSRSRPWFVPIVETLSAAEQIEAILRIERIDLVYVGAYDLSAQLGCAGQMTTPALIEIVDRVLTACRGAGKPSGIMALTEHDARSLAARGVQALVHGVETHRIKQAAAALVSPLRGPAQPADAAPLPPQS